VRVAGRSVGRLMQKWRDLREKHPELLQNLEVYQQPAAFVDGIIMQWRLEGQCSRFRQTVWQRDLFSAALQDSVRAAMGYSHQLPCWIGAKMTAVLQVTDTDVAFPFKAACNKEMEKLRLEMKQSAAVSGARAQFKCGPYELLRVAQAGQQALEKQNLEHHTILSAAWRNGLLSWRPSLVKGVLERSDSQQWAAELKEGSGRLHSKWLDNRYSYLDATGKPVEPDWSRSDSAAELADMEELDYSSRQAENRYLTSLQKEPLPEYHIELGDVEEADAEIFSAEAALMQKPPRERFQDAKALQLLTDAKEPEVVKDKKAEKKSMRRARLVFRKEFRQQVKTQMAKGLSREEVLRSIVAQAKVQKSKKKSNKKTLEATLCMFAFLLLGV